MEKLQKMTNRTFSFSVKKKKKYGNTLNIEFVSHASPHASTQCAQWSNEALSNRPYIYMHANTKCIPVDTWRKHRKLRIKFAISHASNDRPADQRIHRDIEKNRIEKIVINILSKVET